MRRIDKLILQAFIGPFLLTTVVATFILLIQYMLKYFDDFVGKDLGFTVFAELIFYFSLNMLQVALPLGVLVSSLMTFGNLGEHFELTAIKSAGISLVRALRPIFVFVFFLSFGAFWFNNNIVPAANLKAYSLLYDIKNTKPALDIKPGVFYGGIPNYSIKAERKLSDNKTLLNVMIYDHTERDGNRRVILADSSLMYTIFDDKFLKLELYSGNYYLEQRTPRKRVDQFYRTSYDQMDLVFPLSSFDLKRTKEELFRNNRQMKDIAELSTDIDSMNREIEDMRNKVLLTASSYLPNHFASLKPVPKKGPVKEDKREVDEKKDSVGGKNKVFELDDGVKQKFKDTIRIKSNVENASMIGSLIALFMPSQDTTAKKGRLSLEERKRLFNRTTSDTAVASPIKKASKKSTSKVPRYIMALEEGDSVTIENITEKLNTMSKKATVITNALRQARNMKVNLSSQQQRKKSVQNERNKYEVEKYKKYSQAFACIVMFLIGAPLGAIIKKGGLGVPVIISILFFIIYYVLTISSEKWAKAGMVDPALAVWSADLILLPFGFFFLRQARIDARLFDSDFYLIALDKIKNYIEMRRKK